MFLLLKINKVAQWILQKLKAEVIYHNDFIGRYSVLSELECYELTHGFFIKKFRRLNHLVKNKKFINNLILNVSNTLNLIKRKNLILLF